VSQLSRPPAFSYPNQPVIRPPLSRTQRNRAFIAGAVSNTVLTAGLTIVSLAGILFLIVGIVSLVWAIVPKSDLGDYRPLDEVLAAVGLAPEQGWIVWIVLIGTMILGAAVCAGGIWIGKDIAAAAGVARPWAVTWSATGILVGLGLIASTVISPVAGPLMLIVFGAVLGSGSVSADAASDVGLFFGISVLATILGFVVYAAAGSLVWWWMAHALRRAA
jgi:hypothetical protein